MDPITVQLVLNAGKLSLNTYKTFEIINRLKTIQAKLDQLILREIKSSFEAVIDALMTNNKETRNIRLKFAEENLLKNTNLNPSLKTGSNTNIDLMSLANFGLAFVCNLREDTQIAARHLLKSYETSPRLARTILLPDIYENLFEPKCSDLFDWYQKRKFEIQQDNYELKIMGKKATGTALAIGGIALGIIARSGGAIAGGVKGATEIFESATPDHYREKDLNALKEELESKIDERCQKISNELLSGNSL